MPFAAKTPCRGCGVAIHGRLCEACRGAGRGDRRLSSTKRGYDYRWQQYRETFLAANPLCVDPDKQHVGVLKLATDVDHIEPVSGAEDTRFWDETNHQPLCHECHGYKTATHDGGYGRMDGGG